MTREEIIKSLGLMEHVESIVATYDPGEIREDATVRELKEACRMAVSVLRAQQAPAKLDREQWEGCGLCKKASRISGSAFVHYGHEEAAYEGLTFSCMKYCPDCGRPLT